MNLLQNTDCGHIEEDRYCGQQWKTRQGLRDERRAAGRASVKDTGSSKSSARLDKALRPSFKGLFTLLMDKFFCWQIFLHLTSNINNSSIFCLARTLKFWNHHNIRKPFRGDSKLPDHNQEHQDAQGHLPCRF